MPKKGELAGTAGGIAGLALGLLLKREMGKRKQQQALDLTQARGSAQAKAAIEAALAKEKARQGSPGAQALTGQRIAETGRLDALTRLTDTQIAALQSKPTPAATEEGFTFKEAGEILKQEAKTPGTYPPEVVLQAKAKVFQHTGAPLPTPNEIPTGETPALGVPGFPVQGERTSAVAPPPGVNLPPNFRFGEGSRPEILTAFDRVMGKTGAGVLGRGGIALKQALGL